MAKQVLQDHQQVLALEVLVKLTQSQMVQLQYFMLEVAVVLVEDLQDRMAQEDKVEVLMVVYHLVRKMLQQIEVVALVEQEVTKQLVLVEKEL
mgnify:CR=1 FL=1